MELREQRRPQMPDFSSMSPDVLEPYIIKGLKDEIKQLRNICNYEGISLKERDGFINGLRTFREKYCSDEGRKFYSDELIELLGNLYDEHRDKLNLE